MSKITIEVYVQPDDARRIIAGKLPTYGFYFHSSSSHYVKMIIDQDTLTRWYTEISSIPSPNNPQLLKD